MIKIGLTGGIGSGKSTIANLFKEYGVNVLDADNISRELMSRHTPQYKKIVNFFGTTILDSDKNISRKRLRKVVFNNTEKLKFLEKLLHPSIQRMMNNRAEFDIGGLGYSILEIPLLIERRQYRNMNRVIVVTCNVQLAVQRLIQNRHFDQKEVIQIIQKQTNDVARIQYADDIIKNNGSIAQLKKQVSSLHHKYLTLFNPIHSF